MPAPEDGTHKLRDHASPTSLGAGWAQFFKIDKDNSGEVSIYEFLSFFKLKSTKFAMRAFSIMDEDKSGEIDFREFVVAVWNYCTFSNEGLILFAFDLFDLDNSGEISVDEMEMVVAEVYGEGYSRNALAVEIIQKIQVFCEAGSSGEVNKEQFVHFTRHHSALLFPVFTLQGVLQRHILGKRFWKRKTTERNQMKGITEDVNYRKFAQRISKRNFAALGSGGKKKISRRGESRTVPLEAAPDGYETTTVEGSVSKRRAIRKEISVEEELAQARVRLAHAPLREHQLAFDLTGTRRVEVLETSSAT